MRHVATGIIALLIIIAGVLVSILIVTRGSEGLKRVGLQQNTENNQDFKKTARVYFSPSQITASKTSTVSASADIILSAPDNEATSVQWELKFDPLMVRNFSIVPAADGNFFAQDGFLIDQKVDLQAGRVSFLYGVPTPEKAKTGEGKIATVHFTPVFTGINNTTSIHFLEKSMVAQVESRSSVLEKTSPLVILFQ